jgi:Helix-turn-helix domain
MSLQHDRGFQAENAQAGPDSHRVKSSKQNSTDPAIVVCVFIVPKNLEAALETLHTLVAQGAFQAIDFHSTQQPKASVDDPWLSHSAAAEYLGVSSSTLYRYACHERIETRKLAGRLEYRRSTLNQFKEQQIRSPRTSRTRATIVPTLGSGN